MGVTATVMGGHCTISRECDELGNRKVVYIAPGNN